MKPLDMLVVLLVTSAALVAAPVPVPPVAAFSSVCVPTTCLFDGHASTGSLVRFRWTFGDKVITENRFPPTPYALHPYAIPGVYSVKLQVLDATGQYDSVTISVVVPPIRVIHDTVIVRLAAIHDTLLITLPAVHDTVRLAAIHDTVTVRLPTIHDTVTVRLAAIHDTLVIRPPAVHDTVFTGSPITVIPAGIVIVDPNGERRVMYNNQVLGKLAINNDGTVGAYRFLGAYLGMPLWQTFANQVQAILGLMGPP